MSPIRKSERARYPTNWKAISHRIRFARAEGRCECTGECGDEHGIKDGGPIFVGRCAAMHGRPAPISGARVVLTVAHLDHTPENVADSNLKALCQRCHLRYDKDHHAETRSLRAP